jgi:hypothetical protein
MAGKPPPPPRLRPPRPLESHRKEHPTFEDFVEEYRADIARQHRLIASIESRVSPANPWSEARAWFVTIAVGLLATCVVIRALADLVGEFVR